MTPFWRYMRASLQVRVADRGNVVVQALADALSTLIGIVLVVSLFYHAPAVRGFTRSEALIAWGLGEASLGAFLALFSGLWLINPLYILDGQLDRLLRRPLDPYLQILIENIRPSALSLVVVGAGATAWGASQSESTLGWWWLVWPIFVIAGAAVIGGMLTVVASLGFWVSHPGSAIGAVYQLTGYTRYPVEFLPRPLGLLVLFIPFAFAGYVPATWFMDQPLWWPYAAAQPLVALLCTIAGQAAFRRGLRRYASVGS